MNFFRNLFFTNPELIRNLRAQSRVKRLAIAAIVSGIVSLVIIPAMLPKTSAGETAADWGYARWVVVVQSIVLILGGGLACLQAISREKELNTFDYQRITRLSPLELAIGKLFGAPSMAYFVALCFVPAGLAGMQSTSLRLTDLLAAWALLLCTSLGFHALALMLSMLLSRALSTGAVLLFLLFSFMAAFPGMMMVTVGALEKNGPENVKFYGVAIPFTPFFCFVYLSFALWFLLALARNIKRDPSDYELFTPVQALILVAYINFLFVGTLATLNATPLTVQTLLAWINMGVYFALGLVLVRNRPRTRRRLRLLGQRGESWMEALWPAPYLLLGVFIGGLFPIFFVGSSGLTAPPTWDGSLYVFRWLFFGLWLCRDILYLQWMNLRAGKSPLLRALLYEIVFYGAAIALFFTSVRPLPPGESAFQSIFLPVRAWDLSSDAWNQASGTWLLALLAQAAAAVLFAYLHRRELHALGAQRKVAPPSFPSPAPAHAR